MAQLDTLLDYLFLSLGPCAVVYSIVSIVQVGAFIRCSAEVDGEVVRLEQSQSRGRYGCTYAPVFSFTSIGGLTHGDVGGWIESCRFRRWRLREGEI